MAERTLAKFRQRMSERLPEGLSGVQSRLVETRNQLLVQETQLQALESEILEARRKTAGTAATPARVEQEIAQVRAELVKLQGRGRKLSRTYSVSRRGSST